MMTAAEKLNLVSIDTYLTDELASADKHEYLGGYVYAMAGGSVAHNRISTNILGSLFGLLKGQPCQPYNSDMKIRVQLASHTRFYYPDVSVVCDSNSPQQTYQDRPVLIVEVLSRATRRTDEAEKLEAYLAIPSLQYYLLVEQELARVTVHRRDEQGFVDEVYTGLEASISLNSLKTELLLSEIYSGIDFSPEPEGKDL
jgi:Uma2 family endonuclease